MTPESGRAYFGEVLQRVRLEVGLTQDELAERSGLTVRAISYLETGRTRKPYQRTVRLLAKGLGLSGACLDTFAQAARGIIRDGEAEPAVSLAEPRDDDMTGVPPADAPVGTAVSPGLLRPMQLTADLADFVGREKEIKVISDHLSGAGVAGESHGVRIVAVVGMAGVGKTALCTHAAHQVRDLFPDGQLYANLEGIGGQSRPAYEVLARFLRDLHVRVDLIEKDEEALAAQYRSLLSDRRMLIVLDYAHDARQVRPFLPGAGTSAVLISSRDQMAALESAMVVKLDPLTRSSGRKLLTRVVGDERVGREPAAAERLLALCDGLPLAIRIAGARLSSRPNWSVAMLADKLACLDSVLDELEIGDLAVRASFQASYDTLPEPGDGRAVSAAQAFRVAASAEDAITLLEASRRLCKPDDQVEKSLEELVDANLIDSPAPGVYRINRLLKAYYASRSLS
jgi:transcriptional regulator with XRE-family HTH domain/predicted ATPase